MKKIFICFSFIISVNCFSQEKPEDQVNSNSDLIYDEFKNIDITKGNLTFGKMKTVNTDLGLEEAYNTNLDEKVFSLTYAMNSNFTKFTQIASLQTYLGYKWGRNRWFGPFVDVSKINFESLTETNQNILVDENEINNASETVVTFGAGSTFRTTYIRDFWGDDNVFETIGAFIGWTQVREEFRSEDFRGPGIKAEYGIHWRISKFFHLGTKLSYNWYSVKRGEGFEDEPQGARHLAITWLSLGADFSIYF